MKYDVVLYPSHQYAEHPPIAEATIDIPDGAPRFEVASAAKASVGYTGMQVVHEAMPDGSVLLRVRRIRQTIIATPRRTP